MPALTQNTQPPVPRRVLIISPSFPPNNAPDMQRVRMSLPHYHENGWEPVVLAVAPETHGGSREEELEATVPADIRIHRVCAFPVKLARLFGIGNLGLRAWWSLFRAGKKIIREEKIDLVFISNTQFVSFTLGRLWLRLTGVPYVIDLQDPWRTDYYEQKGSRKPPGGWKYKLARFQARHLESWSFRKLSGLISVSGQYIDDLGGRYSWFRDIPTETIIFGASENDLTAVRKKPAQEVDPEHRGLVRLVYTGAAGPITPHAVNLVFQALKNFHDKRPDRANRLRLEFHGTSYAPADRAQPTIMPYAERLGVSDLVRETAARMGHLDALRLQTEAHGLMLLGSADTAYSPSKLYPYFLAGRPMLGLVPHNSVLEKLLQELNCAHLISFDLDGENSAAVLSLQKFFELALAGFPTGFWPTRNEELFRREYLAPALTARQCALFDAALAYHQK
ncbi:MAG: glycosyltransferase [Verrucomicrobia bacterium]|nr:glycosyltransferase [Verrucomicrobiota bacterium]